VLAKQATVGARVAIVGAGGIGFDVAEFLLHEGGDYTPEEFCAEWGIDRSLSHRGGVVD
jgi:2,4-dienoyl-CoA reductase (NADPH2)